MINAFFNTMLQSYQTTYKDNLSANWPQKHIDIKMISPRDKHHNHSATQIYLFCMHPYPHKLLSQLRYMAKCMFLSSKPCPLINYLVILILTSFWKFRTSIKQFQVNIAMYTSQVTTFQEILPSWRFWANMLKYYLIWMPQPNIFTRSLFFKAE